MCPQLPPSYRVSITQRGETGPVLPQGPVRTCSQQEPIPPCGHQTSPTCRRVSEEAGACPPRSLQPWVPEVQSPHTAPSSPSVPSGPSCSSVRMRLTGWAFLRKPAAEPGEGAEAQCPDQCQAQDTRAGLRAVRHGGKAPGCPPNSVDIFQKHKETVAPSIDSSHLQFSSAAQSCPTLRNPMDRSMPGLPVHHQLSEFAQTHVHQVGDAIQPSHPLLCPPLLLPSIFPSIRVFSNESVLRIRWPKYWSFSFNISASNEHSGLISFRMDWLDLLVVQGTRKSLLQHHSSKTSILQHSAFLMFQLSHSYMTTGKTIALTRWTFLAK